MKLKLVRAATAVAPAFSMGMAADPPAHAAFPGSNGRIVFDDVVAFWNGQAPASNPFSIRPGGRG